jgi:hypothetical protein
MKFKPPISDINAPDLYIPLMGFLTYCVLCCLADVLSVPSKFKPEVRPTDATFSRACVLKFWVPEALHMV